MDPNGDGWISISGGAFTGGNELPEFEIPFIEVPQLTAELNGDLHVGPRKLLVIPPPILQAGTIIFPTQTAFRIMVMN